MQAGGAAMRRDCQPCLVIDGKHEELERISFTDSQIREGWLQNALNESPDILPVSKLDSSFAPLVSLGREILNIDNLFVSPSGRITLVETKLWRNPESTRIAIAQIMDYAQRLRELSYEDLEEKARSARDSTLSSTQTIHELVSEKYPDETEDEADFIDSASKTLRSARFLLLIVGDGIKENLEGMVDLLQTQPQMLFTLGLVQLQVYEHKPTKGRLIVPQIVAHSTEIVRAVVKVRAEGKAEVSVSMEPEVEAGKGSKQRVKLDEAEFYEVIEDSAVKEGWRSIVEEAKKIGFGLEFASKSVSLCVDNPFKDDGLVHLFRLRTTGQAFPHSKIGDRTPQDKQLKAIAMSMAGDIGRLYGIPCQADKPRLTTRPTAKQVLGKKDELLQILRRTFTEIEALGEQS